MRLSGQLLRQRLVDQRIELALLAHHAGDDVAEEGGLGGEILLAFDLAADPVAFELGEDFVHAGAGDVHLVERLHRGEPRRAAPVRLARVLFASGALLAIYLPARLCLSAIMASAARAALAPLLRPGPEARAKACASLSTVRMPLPSGKLAVDAQDPSARAPTRSPPVRNDRSRPG